MKSRILKFEKILSFYNLTIKNINKNKEILFGILLLFISIFLFISFFLHWRIDQNEVIEIGSVIYNYFIYYGIGITAFLIPILLFYLGINIIITQILKTKEKKFEKIIYRFMFLSIWSPLFFYFIFPNKSEGLFVGIFGYEMANISIKFLGNKNILLILLIISILFYIFIDDIENFLIKKIWVTLLSKKIENKNSGIKKCYKKNKISYPNILKYDDSPLLIKEIELFVKENEKKIIRIFNFYKIKIQKIKINIGYSVTLYEIYPEIGTKISKIKNLENEIALNLSASSIRIIAPIPKRGSIGIEIPNKKNIVLYLGEIIFSKESDEKSYGMEIPILLGKTIFNEIFITDLSKMPHLLIAGATGQGKSVGLNIIITFLLHKKKPKDLKFILIDPKKVELSIYKNISKYHFAMMPSNISNPIITNTQEIKNILNSLCQEMDNRYLILEKYQVRNIKEYNAIKSQKKKHLPYIVLIIDEFSDLLGFSKQRNIMEQNIVRLSQLSRAVGIHLIIATQRPSVNVITGLIKSNFPARVSFKVSSKIDSRTILDCSGAEKLVGKGDLLFSLNKNELIRLQCPFIDLLDIKKIINFYEKNNYKKEGYILPKPYLNEN